MIMNKRSGFTLTELVVATMISGFIAVSLITVYSTANRHVFQNYRGNTVKSDAAIGMRAIRNAMAQATRIDSPGENSTGNRLEVVSNVDSLTGCYPIYRDPDNRFYSPPSWYIFCTVNVSGNTKLFYYSGTFGGSCACPGNPCAVPVIPNVNCGANGNNVMQLAQFLNTAVPVFSRSWSLLDVPNGDKLSVRVQIHSVWQAAGRGTTGTNAYDFSTTQRDVDTSLDSTFSISRPGN